MQLDHYATLGRSGLRVSPLCLGGMTFGLDRGWGSSVEESKQIIDRYLDQGGNFIDTANSYNLGHPEKIIGDHITNDRSKRDRIVIATKFSANLYDGDPNGGGEVIISSSSLMRGYLNRPDDTANSLRKWHGRTWMHSGDVGIMDEEGYVYLKDRAKDMIIVSGFKVFSVEVEDKLAGLEFITLSALIGSPDANRPGSEIVNLYVELTQEAKQLDSDQVRTDILEFCRAEMAAYKVPKVIHLVDAIPLTPVGKIDKKTLRDQAAQECAR